MLDATMTSSNTPVVSLSIVSHGQGALVRELLCDLRTLASDVPFEVIVTLNLPEDESFLEACGPLPLRVLRNTTVKGFGANHNAAFAVAQGSMFVVVNPDIRAQQLRLAPLLEVLNAPRVGACGPTILSHAGTPEDSPRRFPTLWRLAFRLLSRRRSPDYGTPAQPIEVDWVAGMFAAFCRDAFRDVGGFDEGFFMYMEDADICRRLRQHGWATYYQPGCSVVHQGQRKSHRKLAHLAWHAGSALRFFLARPDRPNINGLHREI